MNFDAEKTAPEIPILLHQRELDWFVNERVAAPGEVKNWFDNFS
jgi:hypothetical protein